MERKLIFEPPLSLGKVRWLWCGELAPGIVPVAELYLVPNELLLQENNSRKSVKTWHQSVYSEDPGGGGGTAPSARVGSWGSWSSKAMVSRFLWSSEPSQRALRILGPRPPTGHCMGDLGEGSDIKALRKIPAGGCEDWIGSRTHIDPHDVVVTGGDFRSACRGLNTAWRLLSYLSLDL